MAGAVCDHNPRIYSVRVICGVLCIIIYTIDANPHVRTCPSHYFTTV